MLREVPQDSGSIHQLGATHIFNHDIVKEDKWCVKTIYFESSHKILHQYNNTGATWDKLESNIGGANNHEPEMRTRR